MHLIYREPKANKIYNMKCSVIGKAMGISFLITEVLDFKQSKYSI